MGAESNVFFLDLNLLDKKGDESLKAFATREELDEKDIIKIIYNEANRIGIKDKVKVTFKILDEEEGTFKVIVEPAYIKYKGTVIYPFETIKSQDFQIPLDMVCGKVTLYNKKEEYKKISVTIDYVALDLFTMTYKQAKEFLVNISDRKGKNGYIEFPDSICFKQYGVRINARKDEYGNVLEKEPVLSIDVYNKEAFFKKFYFKDEKQEEKYDININIGNEEKNREESIQEDTVDNIIEFKRISKSKSEKEKKIEEIPLEETLTQDSISEPKIDELKKDVVENFSSDRTIDIEIEIPTEAPKEDTNKIEEKASNENQKEIEELEQLLEEEQKQQEILEQRIKAKLEELKSIQDNVKNKKEESKKIEEIQVKEEPKEIIERISVSEPEGYRAYTIESYEGIKEQGENKLSLFFGQSKDEIRKYFGGNPKEVRDYEEMEIYDIFYAYYDDMNLCTGIGIYNQEMYKDKVALYFLNENLITMKYKDIVSLIKKNDFGAIEDEDGIISIKYGISVDPKEDDNFKEEICDVIHIFKKGYYDEVYDIG